MEGRRRHENVGKIAVCDFDFGPMRLGGGVYQDALRSSTQLVGGAVLGRHLECLGLVHQRPGFVRGRFGPALDQFDRSDDARGFRKSLGNLVGRGTQLSGQQTTIRVVTFCMHVWVTFAYSYMPGESVFRG